MAAGDLQRPEILAQVLERLAAGETTRKITQELVIEREFWQRMQTDEAFAASVARARICGQDALTAETIDIADEATEETVNSARLRIWARQWYASKMAPKKYGDKLDTSVTHEAGDSMLEFLKRARGN